MLASILEIPNASGSDTKTASDPYAADQYDAPQVISQYREWGTIQVVVIPRIPRINSPVFVTQFDGKLKLHKSDNYGTSVLSYTLESRVDQALVMFCKGSTLHCAPELFA